ncbi:MAG: imidazole glycerol phosphate synthase subunit HisF [Alphaproteobacteria bacterium]|nr:imidazole glycerol phosphate synthase subunit HisF [Alphaproteobacteria bacterium]
MLLRKQRLVKGVSYANHQDAGAPATTAKAYDAQKADELILVDIDAAREGRGPDLEAVRAVARNCMSPLTVGGGIVSPEIGRSCLGSGADKLCVNSTALAKPSLIEELAHAFGSQAVALALDLVRDRHGWLIYDHLKGTCFEQPWQDWVVMALRLGAGEIKLTSVDREGTRTGLDIQLWQAARAIGDVPMILEGGAGSLDHLAHAMTEGVDSIAIGTMLVFSDNNIIQLKRHLKNIGFPIRM